MPTRREQIAKLLDQQVLKILTVVKTLENVGQEAIATAIGEELTETKKKQLLAHIQRSAVIADQELKQVLISTISGIYVSALNYTDTLLKRYAVKTSGGLLTVELLKTAPELKTHLAAVNSLLSDAYLDFGSGMTGWIKGNEHILNDTIRKQIQSKIGTGRLTGEAIREIKKEVATVLKTQGLEALIDRGGKQWTLDRYSEMLTRTHMIKANTEATINRAKEFDIDIVEVSTHGTKDELCLKYEGNIYSLSGKSSNYPKLPENPPFHPNCKHTLMPRPDLE